MNKNILFVVNFANFAKLGVKSFAFREILKTQKISNTNHTGNGGKSRQNGIGFSPSLEGSYSVQ